MLLLDSAVLIWVLIDSPRLGATARERIRSAVVVHVSAVTIAELTIKAMFGKLAIPAELPAAIAAQGFTELPLSSRQAAAVIQLPELVRHDPFDRLLLAQASVDGLEFMTSDGVLLGLGRSDVIDARE